MGFALEFKLGAQLVLRLLEVLKQAIHFVPFFFFTFPFLEALELAIRLGSITTGRTKWKNFRHEYDEYTDSPSTNK